MPALPWRSYGTVKNEAEYTVMASRLPLRRYRDIRFFLGCSKQVEEQPTRSAGLIGYGLYAQFLRKTFWTLSVWQSRDSLEGFARAEPHRSVMRDINPLMAAPTFVTWRLNGSELPIGWRAARDKIAIQLLDGAGQTG